MPQPLFVPRINNNDDQVKLIAILVSPGEAVQTGQAVAEIESEKATVVIEAESDGYVLETSGTEGEVLDVGAVLVWIGAQPDETVPQDRPALMHASEQSETSRPTAGALALMKEHGLAASDIPLSGRRLKVSDVEAFLSSNAPWPKPDLPAAVASGAPDAGGKSVAFSGYEAAMLHSVSWHAREAATSYLETVCEGADWQALAHAFRDTHALLSSPMVPLMAYQLVRHTADNPALNTTVHRGEKFVYDRVNLGFTVHIGGKLFLPVIHGADDMDAKAFVDAFAGLHRSAIRGKLQPSEMQGATVAISSMARWPVLRHMPILPPFVSLMVAHCAAQDGRSILGATYDHRVLDGAAAYEALHHLSSPDEKLVRSERT